jgi:hypothetical protein
MVRGFRARVTAEIFTSTTATSCITVFTTVLTATSRKKGKTVGVTLVRDER